MKTIIFIIQVAVLLVVILFIATLGLIILGDILFGAHGGKNPLVANRQFLTAGIMVCTAFFLSFFSRFTRGELLTSAGIGLAILVPIAGLAWDAQIAWELSWCTTIPFAISICLSIAVQRMKKIRLAKC